MYPTIRPIKKQDVIHVSLLHQQAVSVLNSRDYPPDVINKWLDQITPKNIQDQLNSSIWIVAEAEDQITGFAQYSLSNAEIYQINTSPQFTNQGIGSKLLDFIENQFKQNNVKQIILNSTITAKDFYVKHGYTVVKPTKFKLNQHSLDMFIMSKKL